MEGIGIQAQSPELLQDTEPVAQAPIEETADEEISSEADADADEQSEEIDSTPDYAALAREDLAQLKEQFPALSDMESLCELEDPARYGALRELGLTVREAYLATTTPKAPAAPIAHTYDNRSHLRSSVPRTHGAAGEQMSAQQMRAARELFSDLSDSEIVKLYKKVHL